MNSYNWEIFGWKFQSHKNTMKDFTNRNQSRELMKLMVSLCC